ncbi:MAG: peptidylprolyl isomerase [Verrucomicrobia bacterium]|nr:peptidylprolyl isomerase [Verrucomicrobiota bacterium]
MQVAVNTVVSMHYTLTSDEGQILDSSRERSPLEYLHGHGNLIPGLESRLLGATASENRKVRVPAVEAYGEREDAFMTEASIGQFPAEANVRPGMQFQADTPQGVRVFTVVQIDGEKVILDGNHPLAGMDLNFDVDILEVRAATEDEIEHGHVHAAGGCCGGHDHDDHDHDHDHGDGCCGGGSCKS